MRLRSILASGAVCVLAAAPALATVFSSIHGVTHDSQHFPVAGAEVQLRAINSSFELKATTSTEGSFDIPNIPLGVYRIHIAAKGFGEVDQPITIQSGTHPVLHFALNPATVSTTVSVEAPLVQTDTVTPTTLLTRAEMDQTPGALRPSSFAIITNYVPGAYVTHDMLHLRGGHQTSWLIDGVSIPNTNVITRFSAMAIKMPSATRRRRGTTAHINSAMRFPGSVKIARKKR